MRLVKALSYSFRKYKHRRKVYAAMSNGLSLGKNVTIMDGVRFDPPHNSLISIGDNTTIGPEVAFIAHDATMFKMLDHGKVGFIEIGADCFIGERSIILPGVRIGSRCVVGAGSVVARDIPDGSVAAGNPCRVLKDFESFVDSNRSRIESGICVDYADLYSEIKRNVADIRQKNPGLKFFYSRGQSGKKLKSHFRFNTE